MRRALPCLAVAALCLAACGGDDDTGDDTGGDTDAAASAPAPAVTAGAGPGTTDPGTTVPADTATSASLPTIPLESVPGPTAPRFSGEGSEAACELIGELDAADDELGYDEMFDPETGPAYWESQFALMDELLAVAPPDIREPLEVVIEANHAWYDAIVAADWNLEDADASMIETPGVDQAGVTLDAYTTDVCGLGG